MALAELSSVGSSWLASAGVVVGAVALGWLGGAVVTWRIDDSTNRYYVRKAVRYSIAFAAVIALAVIWRAFAGRAGVVLGFAAAGVAFAMQEVIGAIAGWVNILSGRIFRIGDRIQMGGVQGDVIDITPLRTKVMEIGSPQASGSWVRGRQFTGRIVAISNKATFTEPVFNFSASFDFIWDEFTVPVSYDQDWERASAVMQEETDRVAATEAAADAVARMRRKFPVPAADLTSRVFATPTDNYMELTVRFVVPVRTARSAKDGLARRIVSQLAIEHIEVASPTSDVSVAFNAAGDGGSRPHMAGDQTDGHPR